MIIKNTVRIICVAIIIIGSLFAFGYNDANADIGTCCKGHGICIIGKHEIAGAYAIAAGKDCPSNDDGSEPKNKKLADN